MLRKTLADEDQRMDIALEVCDEVLRTIDNKTKKTAKQSVTKKGCSEFEDSFYDKKRTV